MVIVLQNSRKSDLFGEVARGDAQIAQQLGERVLACASSERAEAEVDRVHRLGRGERDAAALGR